LVKRSAAISTAADLDAYLMHGGNRGG